MIFYCRLCRIVRRVGRHLLRHGPYYGASSSRYFRNPYGILLHTIQFDTSCLVIVEGSLRDLQQLGRTTVLVFLSLRLLLGNSLFVSSCSIGADIYLEAVIRFEAVKNRNECSALASVEVGCGQDGLIAIILDVKAPVTLSL